VAAIGIKVSRWITMHGLPNVSRPYSFERIVPCGISDKPVGSLAEWIPEINMDQVIRLLWQRLLVFASTW